MNKGVLSILNVIVIHVIKGFNGTTDHNSFRYNQVVDEIAFFYKCELTEQLCPNHCTQMFNQCYTNMLWDPECKNCRTDNVGIAHWERCRGLQLDIFTLHHTHQNYVCDFTNEWDMEDCLISEKSCNVWHSVDVAVLGPSTNVLKQSFPHLQNTSRNVLTG